MLHAGLTGGIACGKSTVAAMMRELGCLVIEADPLAHYMIEPSRRAHEEVVNEFGREICTADGRIDRARLAAIVFADRAKLELLNRIVHPRVIEALDGQLAELARTQPQAVVVVEAALLVESGYHKRLDRLVVVWCTLEQQIERLMNPRAGRGMTREQAERRIAAQMPLDEKRRMADYEIDGSGSLEQTRREVEHVVAELKQLATA